MTFELNVTRKPVGIFDLYGRLTPESTRGLKWRCTPCVLIYSRGRIVRYMTYQLIKRLIDKNSGAYGTI